MGIWIYYYCQFHIEFTMVILQEMGIPSPQFDQDDLRVVMMKFDPTRTKDGAWVDHTEAGGKSIGF